MNKKILLIVIGAVVLGGIVVGVLASRPAKIEYDTYDVARATLKQTVEVTGEVASTQDVDLKFEASGRLKTVAKSVGDAVKTGEIVATLDDRSQAVEVQRAQASVLSAQASLQRVQSGSTPEQIRVAQVNADNAQASLDKARQALADAQASGDATLAKAYGDLAGQMENTYLKSSGAMQTLKNDVFQSDGNIKSDISSPDSSKQAQALSAFTAAGTALASMDADIVSFRAAATQAESDRLSASLVAEAEIIRDAAGAADAMMQGSVPINGTTQAAFDARKAEVRASWSDLNAAVNAAVSQKLQVASIAVSNAATLNAAQQAVKTAEGALASAQASLALQQASATAADVAAARAGVAQAQASLASAQLALDKTRLRAPFGGTLTQVMGRAGSTVGPTDLIAKLHGDGVYEIVADVPETDVAKLATGLKAEITLDAYGDSVKFAGTLTSIEAAQTVIQDVVYYKTRFVLDAQGKEIRAGMTANVKIVAQERDNVLIVPQRAIRQDGTRTVRILDNGQEVTKEVQTGLFGDDGMVEIVSGLSGGEKVILAKRQNGKILVD